MAFCDNLNLEYSSSEVYSASESGVSEKNVHADKENVVKPHDEELYSLLYSWGYGGVYNKLYFGK